MSSRLDWKRQSTEAPLTGRVLAHDIPAMESMDAQMVTGHDDYPSRHLTWAIASNDGVVSRLHIDTSGLATASMIVHGRKWWVVGQPKSEDTDPKRIKLFKKWDDDVISADYQWEAICLDKGDVLYVWNSVSTLLADWT